MVTANLESLLGEGSQKNIPWTLLLSTHRLLCTGTCSKSLWSWGRASCSSGIPADFEWDVLELCTWEGRSGSISRLWAVPAQGSRFAAVVDSPSPCSAHGSWVWEHCLCCLSLCRTYLSWPGLGHRLFRDEAFTLSSLFKPFWSIVLDWFCVIWGVFWALPLHQVSDGRLCIMPVIL